MIPSERHRLEVFPVCVGMNRHHASYTRSTRSVPRVCGDEPEKIRRAAELAGCSPCVWG